MNKDQMWAMYVYYLDLSVKYKHTPVGEKFKLLRSQYVLMYTQALVEH